MEIQSEHNRGWSEIWLRIARAGVVTVEQRWEEIPEVFGEAADGLERAGARVLRTWLLREWAEAHLLRGEPEDVERAKVLFSEALSEYKEMGATGHVERVRARLDEIEN